MRSSYHRSCSTIVEHSGIIRGVQDGKCGQSELKSLKQLGTTPLTSAIALHYFLQFSRVKNEYSATVVAETLFHCTARLQW